LARDVIAFLDERHLRRIVKYVSIDHSAIDSHVHDNRDRDIDYSILCIFWIGNRERRNQRGKVTE